MFLPNTSYIIASTLFIVYFLEECDGKWSKPKKSAFQNVLPDWFSFKWFESPLERNKMTETSISNLGKKNLENADFLDLILWHSVWETSMEEVWIYSQIPVCLILASNFFSYFLPHAFLFRPRWGSDESTPKCSPVFEFYWIIANKISIELILLWCKTFLFRMPRSRQLILAKFAKFFKIVELHLRNFLDFFATQQHQDYPRSCQAKQDSFASK